MRGFLLNHIFRCTLAFTSINDNTLAHCLRSTPCSTKVQYIVFRTLLDKSTGDVGQDHEAISKTTNAALDPVSIDPLYRSRLKKLEKSRMWTLPNDPKNEVYLVY